MKRILMMAVFTVTLAGLAYAKDDGQAVFNSAAGKVQNVLKKGISYDLTASDSKGKNVQKMVVYTKDNKSRMDTASGSSSTIMDGEKLYIYDAAQKSAVLFPIDQQQGEQSVELYDLSKSPDNVFFVKKTVKNGYNCQLVTYEEDGLKTECYLTDDYGFPTCVKESGGNEINMTNFKVGVSNDKFKLPSDVKITDVSWKKSSAAGDTKTAGSFLGNIIKDTANDTVVSGAKEGVDEVSSEEKSKVKEETKVKTKKTISNLFGL